MKYLSFIIFVFFLVLSLNKAKAQIPRTEANGYLVSEEKYPAVLLIYSKLGRCTATLVGPNVILTAAHCTKEQNEIGYFKLRGKKYKFQFVTYESLYGEYVDLALGIVERDVDGVNPMSINFGKEHGRSMIALGFGCRKSLSEAFIKTKYEKGIERFLVSNDDRENVYACKGDSGGPSLAYDYDLKLHVTGVHLGTDLKTLHRDLMTNTPLFKGFVARVVDEASLRVCNYNLDCN